MMVSLSATQRRKASLIRTRVQDWGSTLLFLAALVWSSFNVVIFAAQGGGFLLQPPMYSSPNAPNLGPYDLELRPAACRRIPFPGAGNAFRVQFGD